MPGLVPGIHVFHSAKQGVDGRDKPGHDDKFYLAGATRRMRPAELSVSR